MDAELKLALQYQRAKGQKRAAQEDFDSASAALDRAKAELDKIGHLDKKLPIAKHYTVIRAAWALTNDEPVDYDWEVVECGMCESCSDSIVRHLYHSALYNAEVFWYCWTCRSGLGKYNSFADLVEGVMRAYDPDNWVPLGPEVGEITCSVCKAAPTWWLLFSKQFRCNACKK